MAGCPGHLDRARGGLREGEDVLAGGDRRDGRGGFLVDQEIGGLDARDRFAEKDGEVGERAQRGAQVGNEGGHDRRRAVDELVAPGGAGRGGVEAVGRDGQIVNGVRGIPGDGDGSVSWLDEAEGVGGVADRGVAGGADAVDQQVRGGHARDGFAERHRELAQVGDRAGRRETLWTVGGVVSRTMDSRAQSKPRSELLRLL